jgi:hypothetical protein
MYSNVINGPKMTIGTKTIAAMAPPDKPEEWVEVSEGGAGVPIKGRLESLP